MRSTSIVTYHGHIIIYLLIFQNTPFLSAILLLLRKCISHYKKKYEVMVANYFSEPY